MKSILTILFLSNFIFYSLATNSLNFPSSFSVTLRPGGVFFPQFVPLTSHIYTYVNYSSNGTVLNEYISEKDYANPGDSVPKYQFYINSETNFVYYVDGDKCEKISLSHYPFFCLYVPSYITVLFLHGFVREGYTFNKSYTQCPHHVDIPCDEWYDSIDNITVYANGNALEVMILSGILFKPMVYDDFKPAGPVPNNFLPDMECKETDEFPFCHYSSQNMKLKKLESKMKNLLGL